ncbi:MAG: hypothetical protein IT337_01605, partial [Thermomicrobiales bacterium]|nr:hypothetical protein [Thermomicrobiales bacterium]
DHAAILYPGRTVRYGHGITALRAYPGEAEALETELRTLLVNALSLRPGMADDDLRDVRLLYANVQ